MIPFQERKKIRRILYSKLSLAVLAVLLFAVWRGALGIHQKAQIARSERDIAQRAFEELESRNIELKTSLERLKSDQGIEEEIRQKYAVARVGEEVVVVVDDSTKKGKNDSANEEQSLWQRIILFFTEK